MIFSCSSCFRHLACAFLRPNASHLSPIKVHSKFRGARCRSSKAISSQRSEGRTLASSLYSVHDQTDIRLIDDIWQAASLHRLHFSDSSCSKNTWWDQGSPAINIQVLQIAIADRVIMLQKEASKVLKHEFPYGPLMGCKEEPPRELCQCINSNNPAT